MATTTISSLQVAADSLNAVGTQFYRYYLIPFFILGVVGNTLNVYVFTRPSLRSNPCSIYFLASTCACFIVVYVIIPSRLLQFGYNIDPSLYNLTICKGEYFITYSSRALASWFVVLACVDRYLCSSPHARVRRFSSLKVAYRAVSITAIIIWLSYIHVPIYFTIQDTLDKYSNPSPACIGQKGLYTTFLAFYYLTMYSLCPPFLMLIFGLLTLNNIRQRGKQVAPVSDSTTTATVDARRKRKTDQQLLVMLVVQCIVIALSTTPLAMQKLYAVFTASWYKDPFKVAQDNFFFTVVACQSIVGHVLSFYLFTLSGTIFRREVMKLFCKIFKICGCYNPNVQRDGTHTQDISKTKNFWSARSNMQLTRNRVTSRE